LRKPTSGEDAIGKVSVFRVGNTALMNRVISLMDN